MSAPLTVRPLRISDEVRDRVARHEEAKPAKRHAPDPKTLTVAGDDRSIAVMAMCVCGDENCGWYEPLYRMGQQGADGVHRTWSYGKTHRQAGLCEPVLESELP